MKKCPYCAEEIQDEAIVCKHCGRDIAPEKVKAVQKETKKEAKKETNLVLALMLILACVVLWFLVSGGGSGTVPPVKNIPTAQPISSGAPIYTIIHETGLYANIYSTDPKEILPVGTLLKPANDAKFYDCDNIVDSGVTIPLCYVEVISSGKSGWVIQKWISKK